MKATQITTTLYVAEDGRRFKDRGECEDYEKGLNRKNIFAAMKAKVDEIESIEYGAAPFGYGYVDADRYEYRWFRPKTPGEVEALNSFFNIDVRIGDGIADTVGEWICIEIDGDYDTYTGKEDVYVASSASNSVSKVTEFYGKLGYGVKVEKQEEAIKVRDRALENIFAELMDIPLDPKTGCLKQPYLHFSKGTSNETIVAWFDSRYSKGVESLITKVECGES